MSDLEILQHTLGMDPYGRRPRGSFRNGFVSDSGRDDHAVCTSLVARGLMQRRPCHPQLTGGGAFFAATPEGERYVRENSPAPPKVTRSKQRYLSYLAADSGISFGAWLKAQA